MRRPGRNHSPEFKAKMALAAIQGDLTMAELVKKFDVHAKQVTDWKKQLLGGASDVFGIDRRNQVWTTDITYLPMARGFIYLVAVMDWHSRKVLSWRVSNTMDSHFRVEALEEAIETCGAPEIFNTDQGSQFANDEFTGVLKKNDIQISMDGRGRWLDNVFIERLWRSVYYEAVARMAA